MSSSSISLFKIAFANVMFLVFSVLSDWIEAGFALLVLVAIVQIVYTYEWSGLYLHDKGVTEVGGLKLFSGLIPPIGLPVLLFRYLGFGGFKGIIVIGAFTIIMYCLQAFSIFFLSA